MRWLACAVTLLVAGCAGAPPAADQEEQQAVEPIHALGNVTLDEPVAGNGSVGGITVSATGAAGSWLVIFHPFSEGISQVSASYSYNVQTTGPADAVFWAAPSVVWGQPDSWSLRFSPFLREVLQSPGQQFSDARAGGLGAGGGNGIAGVFAAFAADAPWQVTFEFVWAEGEVVTPEFTRGGDGALFGFGGQQTLPIPNGAAAGITEYKDDVAAGWNHLEVAADRLQPNEVRSYDYRLPGGHQVSGIGTVRGHYAPFVGGGASSGGMVDYVGALDDLEGEATMELTYAAASTSVRMGHMHIPIADMPPGLDPATYAGSTWPFPESIPLPGASNPPRGLPAGSQWIALPDGYLYQTPSSESA